MEMNRKLVNSPEYGSGRHQIQPNGSPTQLPYQDWNKKHVISMLREIPIMTRSACNIAT